jgi:hypothetical protein
MASWLPTRVRSLYARERARLRERIEPQRAGTHRLLFARARDAARAADRLPRNLVQRSMCGVLPLTPLAASIAGEAGVK